MIVQAAVASTIFLPTDIASQVLSIVGIVALFYSLYRGLRWLGLTETLDGFVRGHLLELSARLSARNRIAARWKKVQADLEPLFRERVRLHGLSFRKMPSPFHTDDVQDALPDLYDPEVIALANRIRAEKHFPPRGENLSHGLLIRENGQEDGIDVDVEDVHVKRTDYATIEALRALGRPGVILSAGGVVYCRDTGEILLQRRAMRSATHADCFHTFGGNYEPYTAVNRRDDMADEPLRLTAIREMEEEANLRGLDPGRAPILYAEQLPAAGVSTGFVQYYYLGIHITREASIKVHGNLQEGDVVRFTFPQFAATIKSAVYIGRDGRKHKAVFVPAGLAHILIWLGLGAPDQNLRCPVEKQALATYAAIMSDIHSFMQHNAQALKSL